MNNNTNEYESWEPVLGEPGVNIHGVSGDAEPRGLGAMSGVGGHGIHDRGKHATSNNIYGVCMLLHRFSRMLARWGIIYK